MLERGRLMFPYADSYVSYCERERHKSPITINKETSALKAFWSFYLARIPSDNPRIDDVTSNDIRYFLDTLEQEKNYRKTTINKYLSFIRSYFIYLYEHHLISYYPLLSIKGRSINLNQRVVINWEKHIEQIASLPLIQPFTVLTLIAISLGYHTNEVASLTRDDILSSTNDTFIKEYVVNHTIKDKNKIAYLFPAATKDGHLTANTLEQHYLKGNEKHLQMPLSLYQLRISHIYGKLSKKVINKPKVLGELRLTEKTLVYYQYMLTNYVRLEKFVMPKPIRYSLPD